MKWGGVRKIDVSVCMRRRRGDIEVSLRRLFLPCDSSFSMQCRVIQEKVIHEKDKPHTQLTIGHNGKMV